MTRQQKHALDFIRAFLAEHEFSPTYAEVAAALGLMSKGGVWRLLHALELQGFIAIVPHVARSITLIDTKAQIVERLVKALMDEHGVPMLIVATEAEVRVTLTNALK